MAGVARTLDKVEEKARKNPLADPNLRTAGAIKHEYGESHNVDTTDVGYLAGKEKSKMEEAQKKYEYEKSQALAAQTAAEAAVLEKSQQSQKDALKRKGRRASILTSSQGTDPLGIPGI